MEIKVIKDGTTEEMVYNGLELLEIGRAHV